MAKIALVVLALVAATTAVPIGLGYGGVGVVSKNTHVSSGVVSPYIGGIGMGYGMMGLGYPGLGIGHTVSHSSIGHHVVPGLMGGIGMGGLGMGGMGMGGMGLMGMKGLALASMYPGGIGLGYGLMGGHMG